MRTIPLTQGKVALVDDADYRLLAPFKWYATKKRNLFYAARDSGPRHNRTHHRMHRVILGLQAGDGRQCDHIDGNGLNNQQSNLRFCTATQNHQSQRKRMTGTSKYKGVYWRSDTQKWHSQIRLDGKKTYLGLFTSEVEAARAYDLAATVHHCEFALTNKMLGLL